MELKFFALTSHNVRLPALTQGAFLLAGICKNIGSLFLRSFY